MDLSWDEAKRERVRVARGIDFVRLAAALFDGRLILTSHSSREGEVRFVSVGEVDGKVFAVVWTERDGGIRIITARRARNGEEQQYRKLSN